MAEPTAETLAKIKQAAQWKAAELATWDVVARRLSYASGESAWGCLQRDHREEWNAAFNEALQEALGDSAAEAVLTQRALMRPTRTVRRKGEDVEEDIPIEINQRAAHSLLAHAAKMWTKRLELTGEVKHGGTLIDLLTEALNGNGKVGGGVPEALPCGPLMVCDGDSGGDAVGEAGDDTDGPAGQP